ncbi:MAG: tetratricopeptide repeat protein, partial [Kiritimatiellia bacterium]|nr:tetratricopeptide repeat protein [Kiritimatiellia bacterium]
MIPDRSDTPSEDELQQLHDSSLALGFQYERAADLNTARVFYRMAVRAKPDSAWAWYNYGDILLALKQNGEAVAPLMEAVRLAPG